MVLLITGASHTGKTLLAQRMLEKISVPYLSIDHLKMGLIRSGNTPLTPEDDEELTGYLWPVVREMVKTAVENRQGLIVEGCYIPFDWRRDFDETYLPAIRFVCLTMTDRYIDAHFADIMAHASDIEARLDDTACTADRLKEENRKYDAGFSERGEMVLRIDTDYEAAIRSFLENFSAEEQTMQIETARLKIRMASQQEMLHLIGQQTEEDLKAAYQEMLQGCLDHPDQKEWYAVWMIEKQDGTFVGDYSFKGLQADGSAEIGYGILDAYQGCGYATEAVDAAVKWAFRQPGVRRVEAETDPGNRASQRVLEKCGFVPAGILGKEGPRYRREKPVRTCEISAGIPPLQNCHLNVTRFDVGEGTVSVR